MTARFYSRFSPRPDEDTSDSCRAQVAEMRRKFGEGVAYPDEALSGAEHDRPALLRLMADLRRGDVVYVRDFDRLSRDTHHRLGLAMQIVAKGARLVSIKEGEYKPHDAEWKLTFRILAALGEYQRDKTKERTSQKMLQHQADGRRMSARLPFGKEHDSTSDHICKCAACKVKVVLPVAAIVATGCKCPKCGQNMTAQPTKLRDHPHEQIAIRRARELAEEGIGFRQIASTLDAEGYRCRSANWQHTLARRILARCSEQ